jgi:zinc protease
VARAGSVSTHLDVRSFPGPETIHRRELANGLTVLARQNLSSPSVVVSGYIEAGAIDDPAGRAGLADLTASALMRGSRDRSFEQIYESIESIGASLGFGAGTSSTSFRGKSLAEDLNVLLSVLEDVIRNPVFPEEEVDRLRGEKLTGLTMRDQDTGSVAQLTFDELAYPGHPYRFPSDGYRDTVAALKAADLKAFHRRCYGPMGAVMAVVGAVEPEAAISAVERHLGGWNGGPTTRRSEIAGMPLPPETVRRAAVLDGKSQSDIVLGTPGPSRFAPDFLPAILGNNILGRFGLFGRIGDVVREESGLAYYAYSAVTGGPGPGPWQVIAGVNPANAERAIELILHELERFVTEHVTKEELADNQANFIGRLPLQLESNEGVAGALLNVERYDLGLDYYQRYPGLIAAITRDEILEAARRFINPERLVIALAGPEGVGV